MIGGERGGEHSTARGLQASAHLPLGSSPFIVNTINFLIHFIFLLVFFVFHVCRYFNIMIRKSLLCNLILRNIN
jgi:hypothetical protein